MSDQDELAAIKQRVQEIVESGATKEGAPIGQFMGAMVTLARIQVRLCQMLIERLEQKP